jgi:hypothetical protein
MVDGGGTVVRDDVELSLRACNADQRQQLWSLGVRVGTLDLWCPALVKPGALNWLAALEAAWHSRGIVPPPSPGIGLVAVADAPQMGTGFRKVGDWWLRVDLAERISKHSHSARRAAQVAAEKQANQAAKALAAAKKQSALAQAAPAQGAPAQAVPAETAEQGASPATAPATASVPEQAPPAAQPAVADRPAPVFPSSISAPSTVMAAAISDIGPAPAGGFHVSPDLANSIGLPIKDRLILMRDLGFVTQTPPAQITIATEPHIWWTWRARRSAHAAPHQKFRDARRARFANGGAAGGAARAGNGGGRTHNNAPSGHGAPRREGKTTVFGAQARGGKPGGGSADRGQGVGHVSGQNGGQKNGQRGATTSTSASAHSPFAALAGLFDSPAKQEKPPKKEKAERADAKAEANSDGPATALTPAGEAK